MSRLSRKYGNLNVSQPYGPSRPVTGIALLTFHKGDAEKNAMPALDIMMRGSQIHVRDPATLQNCDASLLARLTVSPLRRLTWANATN
jgi:hypothetical protein